MSNREKAVPFVDLSSVEPLEVRWLMPPLIPLGMITIMEGDPGIGKSYFAMHLAAQVSKGGKLPGVESLRPANVLYISAEDDPAYTIRPRIDAMGGDPTRIRVLTDYLALNDEGKESLMAEVRRKPPGLIIIDPLFAFVSAEQDMYRPNVIRSLLSDLRALAEYNDTAMLIIRHLTKARRDKAIYQGSGSMDVIGAARSAMLVAVHPDNPAHRIIAHVKHNISERGRSLVYELSPARKGGLPILKWRGESDLTAEDLASQGGGGKQSAKDDAEAFLQKELAAGPQAAATLQEKADKAGISKRTLDRARRDLGVAARKKKDGWVWSLVEKAT